MRQIQLLLVFLTSAGCMAQDTLPPYNPDYNGDGCYTVADLMPFLQLFGACPDTTETWTCGGTVLFDNYGYESVLIGDQCWLAENLRNSHYSNGDSISTNLSEIEWQSYPAEGRMTVYGDEEACQDYSPDINACDPVQSLAEYGRLYNWYAVTDSRNVCPEGWHVPSDDEWMVMEQALGMTASAADSLGWRGVDQGHQLKSAFGWSPDAFDDGNGSNAAGFNALPGGIRYSYEFYGTAGSSGWWWSTTGSFQQARYRRMNYDQAGIWRDSSAPFNGFSVRCILD